MILRALSQSVRSVCVLLFVLAAAQLGAATQSEGVRWITPDALAKLKGNKKPLLFDFTAAWCGPCKVLERQVFADPQVAAAINAAFVPVRVVDRMREEGRNSPKVRALQQSYQIEGFPTLVVDSQPSRGKGMAVVGYPGKATILRFLVKANANVGGDPAKLRALGEPTKP